MTTDNAIARIRELLPAATETPWRVIVDNGEKSMVYAEITSETWPHVATLMKYSGDGEGDPNAELIVLLRNHAEDILGRLGAVPECPDCW